MSEQMVTVAATRVSRDVLERIKECARASDRSVSAELRRLINATYSEPAKVQR
jgi:hypothetical protein